MKFVLKSVVISLFLFTLFACQKTQAQAPSVESDKENTPTVIKTLQAQGFDLQGNFQAPSGLTGYAGSFNQQPVLVYVTEDKEHALIGTLINKNGEDIGAKKLQDMVVSPMMDKIQQDLESSAWIADGKDNAERIIYVFSDPNCPYCNKFWHMARPWVNAGKVQLRHIMVGVIRPDSIYKAAAILASDNPSKAIIQNEENYKNGGIKPLKTIPAHIQSQLEKNTDMMTLMGFSGTPAIVYPDAENHWQRYSGMPKEEAVEKILGLLD